MAKKMLTVSQGEVLANMHWGQARRSLAIPKNSHELNPNLIARLSQSYSPPPGIEKFAHFAGAKYELGHKFAVEHVIQKLRKSVALKKSEVEQVRRVLGRVYLSHQKQELRRRAQAARQLHSLEERGTQIFSALEREYEELNRINTQADYNKVPHHLRDWIGNPVSSQVMKLRKFKTFLEWAELLEKMEPAQTFYSED